MELFCNFVAVGGDVDHIINSLAKMNIVIVTKSITNKCYAEIFCDIPGWSGNLGFFRRSARAPTIKTIRKTG